MTSTVSLPANFTKKTITLFDRDHPISLSVKALLGLCKLMKFLTTEWVLKEKKITDKDLKNYLSTSLLKDIWRKLSLTANEQCATGKVNSKYDRNKSISLKRTEENTHGEKLASYNSLASKLSERSQSSNSYLEMSTYIHDSRVQNKTIGI